MMIVQVLAIDPINLTISNEKNYNEEQFKSRRVVFG